MRIINRRPEDPKEEFKPKCPTCGSPDVEKIGVGNKAASIFLFGIFSLGHVSKTFKCLNCKHKW